MARHLIVISNDAMVYEDIETISKLPTMSQLWDRVARVDHVKSIYPTITYPCHCTMMTGVYPNKHGVINNEQLIMGELSSKWIHFRKSVTASTIFDWAKRAGLSTASVFWPVTGGDKNIDYLVNEYWPQSEGETTRQSFINSGSSPEVIEKVVDPNMPYVQGRDRQHPYCDKFIFGCACSIVREFKPNLLLIHPAHIDAYRHHTGVFTERVAQGHYETDMWLADLIKATIDAGIYEDTDFVVTSDHGQINIVRAVAPNVILAENGFIDVDADGKVADYRAFCKSSGASAHVFLKDPNDAAVRDSVYALLKRLAAEEVYGISEVLTREEADARYGLSGDFSFVLETDGYSSFSNAWQRPYLRPLDIRDYRFGHGTHGYMPEKGPQPTLFAFGPHVKAGAHISDANLVDDAPTFAKLLGIECGEVDGTPMDIVAD